MGLLTCAYCKSECQILRQDQSDDSGQPGWTDYVSDCCYDDISELCQDLDNGEVTEFPLTQQELQAKWEAQHD